MCTNYVSNFKSIGQFVPELLKFKVERAGQNYCFDGGLKKKKNSKLVVLSSALENDEKSSNSLRYA